jgi:hypothetical protein
MPERVLFEQPSYILIVFWSFISSGSVVGWGIMLQAGRSRVQLPLRWIFSIDLILPGIFLGGKGRPVRKADNLTAICEPIV